ncbi:hypothetical protein TNCV_4661711 [Trichonephila clavipes]|uniref:Uncharacterized protein n=1 Tax=Trichonephila clavipes TaxID=2585209 RepID=A0A8X6SCR3_TRICX|nr:hypothetical protein TNCV_4661711 [Trichonephila clavipes]
MGQRSGERANQGSISSPTVSRTQQATWNFVKNTSPKCRIRITTTNASRPRSFPLLSVFRHKCVHHDAAYIARVRLKRRRNDTSVSRFVVELTIVAMRLYATMSNEAVTIATTQTIRAAPDVISLETTSYGYLRCKTIPLPYSRSVIWRYYSAKMIRQCLSTRTLAARGHLDPAWRSI